MSLQKLPRKKRKSTIATTTSGDIVDLILRDHRQIKGLFRTLKSEHASFTQKKAAFTQFAPLLLSHAKSEQKSWYQHMGKNEEMAVDAIEGETEHSIAKRLCDEITRTKDRDTFMAKVKVVAELVEHHIKEEEDAMLPNFKRRSTLEQRVQLGAKYEKRRKKYLAQDPAVKVKAKLQPKGVTRLLVKH